MKVGHGMGREKNNNNTGVKVGMDNGGGEIYERNKYHKNVSTQ